MSGDDCTKVAPGGIRFYDNYVPTLGVGDYLVNVTQRINPVTPKGITPIDEYHAISQPFSVRGPRFALPPRDIFSVFPADDAVGLFHQVLPHVVLTQRELPWERDLFEDADRTQQTPWLAVLLFVDGEQVAGQPTLLPVPGAAPTRTLAAPLPAAELVASHDGSDGILWPALAPEWYEADALATTTATVIDVSAQAWAALLPSQADLRYLAHARQVDATAKDGSVLAVTGDGWYSVVVGNRLPDAPAGGQPGRRNIAHLVSLEGLQDYVAGKALPPATKRVRMIALRSWTFTCLAEPAESFSGLMGGLIEDASGAPRSTTFALPATVPADGSHDVQNAATAVARGYVPLRYATRIGEQTFGWYRGPFSPVPVTSFVEPGQTSAADPAGWTPFGTASAALAYDPDYGVFDLSYGAAWETGRALALADASFSQALLSWQRNGHRLIDLILERGAQVPALKGFDPTDPDRATEQTLLDLLEPYAVTADFMKYLVTELGGQLAPPASDGPPAGPEPALPPYARTPSPPPGPQTIATLLEQPVVQRAVRAVGGDGLELIADWLAQRHLLAGVPFDALVPHPDLLPPESIRFFYLDPNWLATLLEGALSIGIGTSRDQLYQDLMKDLIWDTTRTAVQQVRNGVLKRAGAATAPVPDGPPLAGMLLRSAVVSGWPGLEIRAYKDDGSPIHLLRTDRPASDILFCLWPSVPAKVAVDEPPEGIAFGFEDPPPPSKDEGLWLYPRSLDPQSYGMPLDAAKAFDAVAAGAVDAGTGVLRVAGDAGLVAVLSAKLGAEPKIRDVAVQLVRVPEQAVFTTPAGAP